MEYELLTTTDTLKVFLDCLQNHCDAPSPRLYVDLEGTDLSRHGTLSLVTILMESQGKVYLVDVTQLKSSAFTTQSANGTSLRDIFESKDIIKVFFDVRNDSDALFSLYQIEVDGIEDLQLMELASRRFDRRCVNGLAKCIHKDSDISYTKKAEWQRIKTEGQKLFKSVGGGTYDVFDQRPLSATLIQYCCQDVQFMPHLYRIYKEKLCDAWWLKIQSETTARIQLSRCANFNGKGRHMALGPRGWNSWSPSIEECRSRTLLDTSVVDGSTHELIDESQESTAVEHLTSQLQELGPIGSALLKAQRAATHESDDESSDWHYEDRSNWRSASYSEPRDLTACDSECGYCGRCPY